MNRIPWDWKDISVVNMPVIVLPAPNVRFKIGGGQILLIECYCDRPPTKWECWWMKFLLGWEVTKI